MHILSLQLVKINSVIIKLVINVKLRMILINVLNAILLIIVKNNLMKIIMENAYVRMNTMIMVKINYAKSVQIFGINTFVFIIYD